VDFKDKYGQFIRLSDLRASVPFLDRRWSGSSMLRRPAIDHVGIGDFDVGAKRGENRRRLGGLGTDGVETKLNARWRKYNTVHPCRIVLGYGTLVSDGEERVGCVNGRSVQTALSWS